MTEPLVIALDAMGGDNAPEAIIQGAVSAIGEFAEHHLHILLVGKKDIIDAELSKLKVPEGTIEVLHAPEVIENDEVPTTAIRRKKGSSLVLGLKAVKEGNAAAFVSAGSTGALLTAATLIVGRAENVERPALGTLIPNTKGFTCLIDSGANVDVKPSYLAQFAQMGSEYMRKAMGIKEPRVGLINIGSEREKGNALTKEAYALLEEAGVNFIGNLEAREIPFGAADVAVCDAFVGNVVLKYTEGFAKGMMSMVKDELTADFVSKIGALISSRAYKRLKKRFDYAEVGGAPFLGLNALVVKAHGSSNARAIRSAIRQCLLYNEL